MGDDPTKYKKLPQIIAGLGVAMGGFNMGCGLGWASAGMNLLKVVRGGGDEPEDVPLIDSVITSIFNIGAIISLVITGFVMNRLGRKWSMVIFLPLGAVIWVVTGFVTLDPVQIVMRLLIGLVIGVYGGVCPVYMGEISAKEIRGTILVFFQLQITLGILYSYIMGLTKDFLIYNLTMIIPIVLMVVWVLFLPESPFFLLTKGKVDVSKEVLQKLRGKTYNIDPEFNEMNSVVQKGKDMEKLTFKETLKRKPLRRAFGTGLLLMGCQQLSGINAVIFNMKSIFDAAGTEDSVLDSDYQAIIVGVVQVVATLVSAIIVDRVGRRWLMMGSMFFMAIAHVLLFVFFLFKDQKGDDFASTIAWLPLLGLCIFITAFSMGAGPVPWAMIGEIYTEETKHVTAPATAAVSWILSFIITWSFEFLNKVVPQYIFFMIFCGLCILGVVGCFFILVETKNRTFDEVQKILEGNAPEMAPIAFKK